MCPVSHPCLYYVSILSAAENRVIDIAAPRTAVEHLSLCQLPDEQDLANAPGSAGTAAQRASRTDGAGERGREKDECVPR